MNNNKIEYDIKKLWMLPYGTLIEISKDNLKNILELSEKFILNFENYRFIVFERSVSDEMVCYNIFTEQFDYLPTMLEENRDFKILYKDYSIDLHSKTKLNNLIELYTIKLVDDVIDNSSNDFYIEKKEKLKKLIEIKNIIEGN